MRDGCRWLPVLVVAAALLGVVGATAAEELANGQVLDKASWEKAKGLLPDEILRHYKDGEYINKVVDWPQDHYTFPTDLKAASVANEGKYATSPEGTVIDKSTGQQPPFVFGHPFPTIDPADPAAGAKILWNFFYRTWYFGNMRSQSQINWVGPTGLERRADVDVRFAYYDGVPPDERPAENPENFLYRQLSFVTGPADLNGTASLTWRYREGKKRDSTWAYVPALRRVRATSPARRTSSASPRRRTSRGRRR